MLIFILKKFIQKIAVFFLIMFLVFLIPRLAPGSPIDYLVEDPRVPPDVRSALLRSFGLDRPVFPDQFGNFLRNLITGNFGYSFIYQRPVFELLMERLPWTLLLMGSAVALSSLLGFLGGVVTAWMRGRRVSYIATMSALLLRSFPTFWIGMVLLLTLGYYAKLFPMGGATTPGASYSSFFDYIYDVLRHLALPLLTLVAVLTPRYLVIVRNTMVDVIREDFIVVAVAKGLSSRDVMLKHAARNAVLPFTAVLSLDAGMIVGGATVTETVFSYPGVGRLIYESVINRDYPLILGAFFVVTLIALLTTTIAELLYAYLDPRVRVR